MPKPKKEEEFTTLLKGLEKYETCVFLGVRKNESGAAEIIVQGENSTLTHLICHAMMEAPALADTLRISMLKHSMHGIERLISSAKEHLSESGKKPESPRHKKTKSKK